MCYAIMYITLYYILLYYTYIDLFLQISNISQVESDGLNQGH